MLIRGAVAALDFNANIDREIKKTAAGDVIFKPKVMKQLLTLFHPAS